MTSKKPVATAAARPPRARPARAGKRLARSPQAAGHAPKLAEQIAARIERDIIRRGWKVGEILGSEVELARRYGASRWVMREAIGIGERDGLIGVRRGRTGGVVVTAPALEAVGSMIRAYLGVCRVSAPALAEARTLLESLAVSLAAERLDDAWISRLRALAAEADRASADNSLELSYRLLRELLLASGNAALLVFTYTLSQLNADMAARAGLSEARLRKAAVTLVGYRVRLVEAVIGYDLDAARQVLHMLLETAGRLVARRPRGHGDPHLLELPKSIIGLDGTPRGGLKRTEQLMHHIQADIIANDRPVGYNLGSEAELRQRYGVARSVLREAIRPLERMGLVEMRRGRRSGLEVTQPEPRSIIRSAVLYFNHAGLQQADAYAVQQLLEPAAAAQLARMPKEAREAVSAQLGAIVETPRATSLEHYDHAIRDFYTHLVRAVPSPIVSLFLLILADTMSLNLRQRKDARRARRLIDELKSRQRALLDAIVGGDDALARRRMIELRAIVVPVGAQQRTAEQLIG